MRALELPLVFTQPCVLELEGLELAKVLGALGATLHVGEAVDWLLLAAGQGPSEAALPLYRRATADILDCFLEYILASVFVHLGPLVQCLHSRIAYDNFWLATLGHGRPLRDGTCLLRMAERDASL